jgi:MFS family permease
MRRLAASAAVAVVLLDVTAVGVMLPTLRADLGSSPSGGQWVMNAYLLAFALVLPVALQARLDRRLIAALGAVALAAGGAVCATADMTSTLVVGRALEGAGLGALIVPATGLGAAVLPVAALVFGPLIGGELADRNWWHLWFWAAIPAAALLAGAALLEESRAELARAQKAREEEAHAGEERVRDRRAEDGPLGALAEQPAVQAAAIVVVIVVFVQSEPWGLGTRGLAALVGLTVIVTLMAARDPGRAAWTAAGGALASLCFLMPQYFELAHLIHPLRSGARLSVLTVAAVAGGVLGWWLRSRDPNRLLAFAGAAAGGAGAIALYFLDEHSANAVFGAGLLLAGGGFGLAAGATYEGRLGELLSAGAMGAALVLAVTGALFQHTQAELRASGESFEHALSRGVADGALLLLPLAIGVGAAVWRARPVSSAARPAAES